LVDLEGPRMYKSAYLGGQNGNSDYALGVLPSPFRIQVGKIVLDLEQVRLVDLDAVHFLAVCETKGIELRHCPPYVREWILSEKARIRELE